MTTRNLVCANSLCHKSFEATNPNSKFCSHECWRDEENYRQSKGEYAPVAPVLKNLVNSGRKF